MASAKTTAKKAAPKANGRKAKGSAPEAKSFRNTLVVVESPAKAKTIKKYLGSGYTVKASVGHIMDLPKSKMGVDIENGFEPVYEIIKGKQKVVTELKAAAKNADRVLLATDPDREGEAIAWHVKHQIARSRVPTQRVLFNEITKKAIQEAIQKPLDLNRDMYDAQQARRVLDRLVGYQISPILWTKVRRGLSAGRVQSVAVRLVVERENEIAAFVPVEYWSIEADLKAARPPQFRAKLIKLDGKKIELGSQEVTTPLVEELKKLPFTVQSVEKKERRRNAPAPFITSKLQQEAANRLGFSAKKTMTLAQRLYEGVELGEEGQVALITYMRTDSVRLSPEATAAAREYVREKFGPDYLPAEPVQFKTKKSAQDAHEAIRPTGVEFEPSRVQALAGKGIGRPSTYAAILSTIQDKEYVEKKENRFYPTDLGKIVNELLVQAFPKILDVEFTAHMEEELDDVEEGKMQWVKVLDEFYEPFKKSLRAAEKSMRDVKREEQPTDLVCEKCGSPMVIKWGRMGRFLACSGYPDCKNTKDFVEKNGKIEVVEDLPTEENCPTCGKPMLNKRGRFGRFLACSDYPNCKTTRPITLKGVPCPDCGGGLAERRTRFGKSFYGCVNYPNCKFAAWDRPIPGPCPQCGKPYLLSKYSKKEGPYIACPDKECGYRREAPEPGSEQAPPQSAVP